MRLYILVFLLISGVIPVISWSSPQIKPKNYLFKTILIEIDHIKNYYPTQENLNFVKNQLDAAEVCNSKNILIINSDEMNSFPAVCQYNDLIETERKYRNHNTDGNGNNLTIHLMCVKSSYAGLLDAAGLTYENTACAILYPLSYEAENLVILHEIGHVLLRTNYPDGGHCDNMECVMYPIIGKHNLFFDEKCLRRLDELKKKKQKGN